MTVAATYYITLTIISFTLMGVDKVAACVHTQRVPERTFLGLALAGGGPGVLVGAFRFRHKTRKPWFLRRVMLITAAHVTLVAPGVVLLITA